MIPGPTVVVNLVCCTRTGSGTAAHSPPAPSREIVHHNHGWQAPRPRKQRPGPHAWVFSWAANFAGWSAPANPTGRRHCDDLRTAMGRGVSAPGKAVAEPIQDCLRTMRINRSRAEWIHLAAWGILIMVAVGTMLNRAQPTPVSLQELQPFPTLPQTGEVYSNARGELTWRIESYWPIPESLLTPVSPSSPFPEDYGQTDRNQDLMLQELYVQTSSTAVQLTLIDANIRTLGANVEMLTTRIEDVRDVTQREADTIRYLVTALAALGIINLLRKDRAA